MAKQLCPVYGYTVVDIDYEKEGKAYCYEICASDHASQRGRCTSKY